MRVDGRKPDELRKISIERHYLINVEGSCLVEFGNTRVICTATVQKSVPSFLDPKTQGWINAEYSMLPRSVNERLSRQRISGRVYEIQRIIGRALRGACALENMPGITVTIDCDVIQADGGTRSASIVGGFVALHDAVRYMLNMGMINVSPIRHFIGAVSVGVVSGTPLLDLNYDEDSRAEVDMNVVMTENGEIVELQATGEDGPFSKENFHKLLRLAEKGIKEIIKIEKKVLEIE